MSVHDFTVKTIDGRNVALSEYRGKALLIVNVASQCGFTPQYAGLEKLYESLKAKGFAVLGFPCNQFGGQEPAPEAEIKTFCETNYGVTFPLFAKIEVNGPKAHPLYQYLTSSKPGVLGTESIKWNFTKFLVDKYGEPVRRYAPQTQPREIVKDLVSLLS
jgi:glutathione peroxidase